jgi:hypothetical protein
MLVAMGHEHVRLDNVRPGHYSKRALASQGRRTNAYGDSDLQRIVL